MNKSVPDSDQHKAAINELVEIGKAHPEVIAALKSKAIEMGKPNAFMYSWGDSVADKAARFDEGTARGFGIAKAGLGSKWTMGSARAAAVSASTNTPAGYAIAGALGLATVGNAYYAGSGAQEAFGGYEHKEGARVLSSLTHHVPGYVEQKATSVGIDLAVGAMGYVTGATISMHVTRAALEAKYVGSAALSAKGAVSTLSSIKPSSLDNPLIANAYGKYSSKATAETAGLGSVGRGKVGAAADATKAVKITAAKDKVVASEVGGKTAKVSNVSSAKDVNARNIPGAASGGESLSIVSEGDKWFRGSHANAAKIPKQIADNPLLKEPRVVIKVDAKVDKLERPLSSPHYSVVFEANLQQGRHYPGPRETMHFQEANKQLYDHLRTDVEFKTMMESLYPGITKSVSPGARGAFPMTPPTEIGMTWHHNAYEQGVLELIPRVHHQAPNPLANILHPDGKGGMYRWGGGRPK